MRKFISNYNQGIMDTYYKLANYYLKFKASLRPKRVQYLLNPATEKKDTEGMNKCINDFAILNIFCHQVFHLL